MRRSKEFFEDQREQGEIEVAVYRAIRSGYKYSNILIALTNVLSRYTRDMFETPEESEEVQYYAILTSDGTGVQGITTDFKDPENREDTKYVKISKQEASWFEDWPLDKMFKVTSRPAFQRVQNFTLEPVDVFK